MKRFLFILFFGSFFSQIIWSADHQPLAQIDQKHDFIEIIIRNETSSIIYATSVDHLDDLGIIPAEWRYFSKGLQWAKSFCCGEIETLQPHEEKILSIPPDKQIAFYRKNLIRTYQNMRQGILLSSSVSAACVGLGDCSGAVVIGSLYAGKCVIDKMERPGERIAEKVMAGSRITLFDPSSEDELCDHENLVQQKEQGRSILIKIDPPHK